VPAVRDCDVLVVGGGGVGMAAAIEAADAGSSVILLEAGKRPGGSTALSGGVFYAAGTSIQKAAGVHDTVDAMYRYYMTFNRWNLEPWLIRRFCEQSAPTLEWLIGLGTKIPVDGLYISGVDDVPRGHHTHGSGAALFERLLGAASARGVEIHANVRVEGLLVSDGIVRGVAVQGAEIRAGATVLATGGYGADRALLAEFNPDIAEQDERWSFYFGSETSRGDGITMARAGRRDRRPQPAAGQRIARFLPRRRRFPSALARLRQPRRAAFHGRDLALLHRGHRIEEQPGKLCFAILDEPTRAASPSRHPFADKLGVGDFAYSCDRLAEEAAGAHPAGEYGGGTGG
jgi:fumarate reductase flavoprotein subunit